MKDYLTLKTIQKEELVDITEQVNVIISDKGVKSGLCCIFAQHTTAAIVISECADIGVREDFLASLRKLIPEKEAYMHNKVDGNATAHIKSGILGASVVVPISDGKLALGQWQAIMFCELDGPRAARRVIIQVIS